MAGVVELTDSPCVRRVLVFSDDGDAGVVKEEDPLVCGIEVQQMRQHPSQLSLIHI